MLETIPDYEKLREKIDLLSRPQHREDLRTLWVVNRLLGVAVTATGTVDILLVGDKLHPGSEVVRRHLRHASWSIEGVGIQVEANKITFPAEPHFISLTALIAVELTRGGLGTTASHAEAFELVEPLIELALRRTALAEEHIIGLVGELLCLEVMLNSTERPELFSSVLDMWRGHTGGRDFTIGEVGIEVKTTQSRSSSHKFSGLHQVETGAYGNNSEQKLFLLSIGLTSGCTDGQSLSELVERIVQKLGGESPLNLVGRTPLQQRFLSEVASYGRSKSEGYYHNVMSSEGIYSTRLDATFTPRLYDLLDGSIRTLERDFIKSTHVSDADLQFRLELPDIISPSNPAPNWARAISAMVQAALSF